MLNSILNGFTAMTGWNAALPLLLVKATLILFAALGITLTMQRASATARHLVWLVTLGVLLLVPALTAWGPLRIAILPAPLARANKAPLPAASDERVAIGPNLSATLDARAEISESSAAPTTDGSATPRPLTLLLAAWAMVVTLIFASLARAAFAVRRIVRSSRPLDSEDWQTPLLEISDRLGLDEPPRLRQSADSKMPFACGVLAPTIVLPADSESWTRERRSAVLLHELAHVRRHDLFGHALGRFACAVYWFHPLVWTAAKRLRSESERACDDLALSCGTRATDYAEHLLDIVTRVRSDSTPLVALAMARRKEFEGRMLAILDPDLRRVGPTRRQSASLIAVLALVSLTIGATAPVARRAEAVPAAAYNTSPITMVVSREPAKSWSSTVPQKPASLSHEMPLLVPPPAAPPAVAASPSVSSSSNATHALEVISSEGARFGMSVAQNLLRGYGDKADPNARNADDRPALLAKVLRTDTSAIIRRVAAWGLQEYADQQVAADALTNALRHDPDARVREMAAWSLAESSDRTAGASDALVDALKKDASDRVRTTAAWALGQRGDHAAEDVLTTSLADASPEVRQRAAWALGEIGAKQAPKPLIALLTDKDPRVRMLAAWALYNIQDPSTASALESAMKIEQNTDAQMADLRALAALGEKSVDAIKGLLESKDPNVKQMAVRALAGGHATGPWPWPWPDPRPQP